MTGLRVARDRLRGGPGRNSRNPPIPAICRCRHERLLWRSGADCLNGLDGRRAECPGWPKAEWRLLDTRNGKADSTSGPVLDSYRPRPCGNAIDDPAADGHLSEVTRSPGAMP